MGGCGIWLVILRTLNWITNPVAVLDMILHKKVFRIETDVDKDNWTPYCSATNCINEISVRTYTIYTKLQPAPQLVYALSLSLSLCIYIYIYIYIH